ncbi:ribosomal RNA-processing protein 8 [Chanos chanos]|uniref:Ribosomal RNA-processing protein 8 n=1 Tax=Chanos chanos TaxID=29144 RepID=A0A6J2VRW0_CHACN|nr:ribosomal RNA-processing protein 8 [Chanos chanos]
MFAEEEWNDASGDDAKIPSVVAKPGLTGKSKRVGKQSLLRTLQTLGSVPVLKERSSLQGSESETDELPSPTKRKKKRCKKRKRASAHGSDGEQEGKTDMPDTVLKGKILKRESKAPGARAKTEKKSVNRRSKKEKTEETEQNGKTGEGKEQTERQFSRKQWKNKMKNKKRCKNKYSQKNTEETKSVMKTGEEIVQTQVTLNTNKTVLEDVTPAKRTRKEVQSKEIKDTKNCGSGKNTVVKNENQLKLTVETYSDTCSKSEHESLNQEHKDTPQLCETTEHRKSDRNVRLKTEKLRQILKQQVVDRNEEITERGEESTGEGTETEKKEEKIPVDRSSALRQRMEKRLESARFRYINETLYTTSSGEARRIFKQDPQAIEIYHRGYTAQVQYWPSNPVDAIISYIRQKPASLVVADFGCGDCKIARSVKNKVHCFDLAPVCDLVTACDMAKVPLKDASVDIVVFCLSLMGTNLTDFLAEANRVLVMGGVLKIAEVASRFDNVRGFVSALSTLGFKLVTKDTENSHFYSFEFVKKKDAPAQAKKIKLELKPCLYKKR